MCVLADFASSAGEVVDVLLERYQHARLIDFAFLAIAVAVSCWFVSKYSRD